MAKRIIKDRSRIVNDGWRLREKGEDGIAVDILLVCTDDQYRYQDCSRIMFDWENGERDHTVDYMPYLLDQMRDWVSAEGDFVYDPKSYTMLCDATPSERYAGWLFVVEGKDGEPDRYFDTEEEARNFQAQRKAATANNA